MSSKPTTQTTTTQQQTDPWEPTQSALMAMLRKYGTIDTGVTGGQNVALARLMRSTGHIPNFGKQASGAVRGMFNTNVDPQISMLRDAYGQLQSDIGGIASGKELDPFSNPAMSGYLDVLGKDITNRTKGVYAGSGRDPSGSGSFYGALSRGLAEGQAPVLANQYNVNRTNQMNAANQLYGAGSATSDAWAKLKQLPIMNSVQAMGMIPQAAQAYAAPGMTQLGAANAQYGQQFQNLMQMLGPLLAMGGLGSQGSGTSTTSQPQSMWSNLMGGAAGIGGLGSLFGLWSDKRMKDNIEKVGKLKDGQDVVRFRYKGSPVTQIGLLAQHVKKTNPSAVGKAGGMMTVDYRKATDKSARMAK